MKRAFDIFLSLIGLVLFLPFFLIIAVFIRLDSKGSIIYKGKRTGKNQNEFLIYKLRTMKLDSEWHGITLGNRDTRITRAGRFLRRFKIDEIPQLVNVLKGDMSIVGPRPDLPDYKKYYLWLLPNYFSLKPGITSYSSLFFSNESDLYKDSEDPVEDYITKTIPLKVALDRKYFEKRSLKIDISIILKTIKKIIF